MPKTKKSKGKNEEAIVVLGGSFSPPHAGHVAALEAGRANAEQDGRDGVAGGVDREPHLAREPL